MAIGAEKPYHHGNLRAALLEGAERTLGAHGAGGLSLRELAREVGVSHAAPRRHFADKQALLDALAEDGWERLGTELHRAVEDAGDRLEPRLVALVRTYVRFSTEHAALLELMMADKHRPGAPESLRAAAERSFGAPIAVIADAQVAGDVVPGDPKRVATVVWAATQGLATLASSGMFDDEPLDEVVQGAVERLVLGLRPRP